MFYDNFCKLCEKNNVKPTNVVLSIGVSRATATKWKNGSTPSAEILQKLADYFGVSVDYLLNGEIKEFSAKKITAENSRIKKYNILFAQLSQAEQDIILAQMQGIIDSKTKTTVIAARNGETITRKLTPEQLAKLEKIIDEI